MKKILILGSNSFAGTSFVKFMLQKKYFVFATSRSKEKQLPFKIYHDLVTKKNFRYKSINVNNVRHLKIISKIIQKNKIKYIVDFASQSMVNQSWKNPEHWVTTNCLGKLKLIKVLLKLKGIKYIRISTPEVYGSLKRPIKEEDSFNPSTPYAVTQSTADFFLKIYCNFNNFNGINLRFANFYGPGQQLYRIIPKTIIAIIKKDKLTIHGDGKSQRSFIYPKDFCQAIFNAMHKSEKGRVYNISSKKFISIINLVSFICEEMKYPLKKLIVYSKDRLGKDYKYLLNSNRARKELDWKNSTNLYDGIRLTIKWYMNNFNLLKNIPTKYIHKK